MSWLFAERDVWRRRYLDLGNAMVRAHQLLLAGELEGAERAMWVSLLGCAEFQVDPAELDWHKRIKPLPPRQEPDDEPTRVAPGPPRAEYPMARTRPKV